MADEQQGGNIVPENNLGRLGMNMDNTPNQVRQGVVTYALNAAVENFDASSVNYQNEPGNELCLEFPKGYHLIGTHFINEKAKHIFFLVNPETGGSEIGYMLNNDCIYHTYVNAPCLNFDIDYPIHKVVHKITNCTTEIYWTDGLNPRRYLDLDNIESIYTTKPGTKVCDNQLIPVIDCNKLKIQPNFTIPNVQVVDVQSGGDLKAGTYQFAIQYCDSIGDGYTSYYSVTNPTPIANLQITTLNFDYPVGKSIVLNINNIDTTGYFKYFNIAVIKTVNAITSVELVGTYFIDNNNKQIIYTGQNQEQIRLSIDDIFEKFPYYEIAQDVTAVQDVLVWDNLTSIDRVNYQGIANKIRLQWQTYRIPADENYADELNATNLRGYLRDEVYAFEIVFLLKNGKQTDGFHIPGRVAQPYDVSLVPSTNPDIVTEVDPLINGVKRWKVYNTGYKVGDAPGKSTDFGYKGEWEYGEFSYWESTELYPCNKDVWGDLADTPIRHHKFPDVLVTPHYESKLFASASSMVMGNDAVFPIGVKIDVSEIVTLIGNSNLTDSQKADIVGFKIVRGDRNTNKSIVGKGLLRNVGKYTRDETEYYYPNYPYNDLNKDPFLLDKPNSYIVTDECRSYTLTGYGTTDSIFEYLDCFTGRTSRATVSPGQSIDICSIVFPKTISGKICMVANSYKRYKIEITGPDVFAVNVDVTYPSGYGCNVATPPLGYNSFCDFCNDNPTDGCCVNSTIVLGTFTTLTNSVFPLNINGQSWAPGSVKYINSITPPKISYIRGNSNQVSITLVDTIGYDTCSPLPLNSFDNSEYRYVFNSPETSFGQPFLGNILKLENVMFGAGKAHFVEVKKHAMYKFLTAEAQNDAIKSSHNIATVSGTVDAAGMFTAYQAYLQIYINGITRRNYAYSFNSIASYDYNSYIDNDLGIKQRELDIALYLIPGVQGVGDDHNVNNWNRESSVYLRTKDHTTNPLPVASQTPSLLSGSTSIVTDYSRFTISDVGNCLIPGKEQDISVVSYYGSLKNQFVNQWGQMYSYDTIDTGFQVDLDTYTDAVQTVFGGDTFISRFGFKTKLPFFIDNRVNAPDDSDIFYDEIGNVAYPKYWFSARSVLSDDTEGYGLVNFISYKAHSFDCPNSQLPAPPAVNPGRTYYDGKMYLFAYGVPYFYCESSINTDLRQAFNNREGDFWPHVSTGIPDDWVQESYVPISQDNTYHYNITYSKQNKENYFSHLPVDWTQDICKTYFPFRAIYSDQQISYADNTINSWLIYRPISKFDFPQNYGKLTSLDGIQNKGILARFENKSLLYNTLLTINTSNPKAAYIGNPTLFTSSPPIDFAETDLGYVGSQHKFLLKIPQGQVTIDAKRGQVFLIRGNSVDDISAFGSGMNRFLTDHLQFEILRYFPNVPVDNHFKGIGLHGVYDSKYDRIIITKLDYIPLNKNIIYDEVTKEFYLQETSTGIPVRTLIDVYDVENFCNKSWSLSFNLNTNSWISFHSYIPNWYIAENNFFYSGINGSCEIDALAAEVRSQTTSTTSTSSTSTSTTTSTTTIAVDCNLDGTAVVIFVPRPITTTTTTTTEPPISSTTTTTTTLCPACSTYLITNTADCPKYFTVTDCTYTTSDITLSAGQAFPLCSCDVPVLPEEVTYVLYGSGCNYCFCYTLENTTSTDQTVSYGNCQGGLINVTMAPGDILHICSIYGSQVIPDGVTSTLGVACTEDIDCDPCNTTTTTTTILV